MHILKADLREHRNQGLSRDDMIKAQRLWWEGTLRSELVNIESAGEMQILIDEMVPRMDGVGYRNRGPWETCTVVDTPAQHWFW